MSEHETPETPATTEATGEGKPLSFNELLTKKNKLQRSIDAATANANRAYEHLQSLKAEHNAIVDAITKVVADEKYV